MTISLLSSSHSSTSANMKRREKSLSLICSQSTRQVHCLTNQTSTNMKRREKSLSLICLQPTKISPIVLQIKPAHDSAKTDIEKQKLLRLVSTELSRKQLEELYDWKVGVIAWRSSQKQPQTPKNPPNCKPLKQHFRGSINFTQTTQIPQATQQDMTKGLRCMFQHVHAH